MRQQNIDGLDGNRLLTTCVLSLWKIKWQLGHLGVLGIMGETTPLTELDPTSWFLDKMLLLLLLCCLFSRPMNSQGICLSHRAGALYCVC